MSLTSVREKDRMADAAGVVRLALDVGEQILLSGGEVGRVEDTVLRICTSYGAVRTDVFAITSLVFVTAVWENGEIVTQSRRIKEVGKCMRRLEELNSLSRRICTERPTLAEAEKAFSEIMKRSESSWVKVLIGSLLAATAYTAFFGGDLKDCLVAPFVAAVIFGSQFLTKKIGGNKFFSQALCSFLATAAASFAVAMHLGSSVDHIMIGCIMILIPGISVTHAVENLIIGDTIAGLISLSEALVIALALAGGFALSQSLFGGLLI
ncbi:MAG: threonine/serine exporter family protein [Clostridia bacterium]|nr:threonine/serine exporter family protein [Clostridia bacterium]